MATTQVINVYGLPPTWKPPTKKQFHATTYLEYEIPKKLEKELSKLVEDKISKFHKECKCNNCKENRIRNKKHKL